MGASGSGKSTLLHLLGALDTPTSGSVRLDGLAYGEQSPAALAAIRNRKIGFVFQFHHLLREFNALENVMMPLLIAGESEDRARSRAEELLAAVGLAGRMTHRPAALSGGEQQRAAVARALAADPVVVLADEPSGNLDHANSELLHALFARLAREFETALVVVTHNRLLAGRADRVLTLDGGHLVPLSGVESMP
jgi:lipoprotein-releasing system ATP-binding protein